MTTKSERTEIELIKQEQSYMNKKIDNIESMMKGFINSADEKYASKKVENVMWAVIWFFAIGLWGGLITLLIK